MKSQQKNIGFMKLENELLDVLIKYRIPGEQMQCLLFIIRKTIGWSKKSDSIPLSQFTKATYINRQNVARALRKLIQKKIIDVIKKDNREVSRYSVNMAFHTWLPVIKKDTMLSKKITPVIQYDSKPVIKKDTLKRQGTKDTSSKDIPSEQANILTDLFLKTLSLEFQKKYEKYKANWSRCFDKLLKEYDADRLKALIQFYRHDEFWIKNFISPLKLLKRNKEGIRFVDYFFESMKSNGGNGRSSLTVGAHHPELERQEEPQRELTPEEQREETIKDLKERIVNAETFISKPAAQKDANAMRIVQGNLERFKIELTEIEGQAQEAAK